MSAGELNVEFSTQTEERSIEVVISPLGKCRVEAKGFDGQGCEDATKPIEDALAGKGGVSRELKPEWNNETDEIQDESVSVEW
jgi:hypothetical protein